MRLLVKDMDIATGGPLVVILNEKDASFLDLHHGDRVKLTKGKHKVVAAIDIAETTRSVSPGKIGLFEEVLDRLHIQHQTSPKVKVSLQPKPVSIYHIRKKLDGKELSRDEIYHIMEDVTQGRLTSIELTYYVAGNYMKGMSMKEICSLTKAMIETGDQLKPRGKLVVDKHCIGGVAGNRTTLGVVPILLAAGLTVPKTSSRAITSPAGTADTMEVLCEVTFNKKKLQHIIQKIGGCVVWGGSMNLAPADDLIINVEHPLSIDAEGQLLASIMAKKGSVSATHVLIDIPIGKGAKIESRKKALKLKKRFEELGRLMGMKTFVVITDGSQPIGNGIGPALEARDVMWMLKNDPRQPLDLRKKCVELAGILLEITGKARKGQGKKIAEEVLHSGKAYKKMWDVIIAQGAKLKVTDNIKLGNHTHDITSWKTGKIKSINNKSIAKIARVAGCPRDKQAGVYLHKHVGDRVKKGEKIMTVYVENKERLQYAKKIFKVVNGIVIGN
jgi:AMP phosphorylase